MKFYFLLFLIYASSCAIQTRYNLKKQKSTESNFQKNLETIPLSLKKNTPLSVPKVTNSTIIANMQSEITQLNTVSEQLTEKINSLEKVILDLKTQNSNKLHIKKKKHTINKATKLLITKKKKRKLGNFAQAQQAFQKKKWETAIENYEKYRKLNPRGNSYALATYNIALSLERLGFREEAKSFYDEILDPNGRHFKSKLAKKIKAKQKKLSSKKAKKI